MLTVSIYKRKGSNNWWVRYRDANGRLHRRSTGTADEQLARRMRDRAPAKHCGILIAQGASMIHAYERCGVIAVPYDRAWRRRAAFAFLFPAPGA